MSLNCLNIFPVAIMWDFVLRLVISLNFSCMTENRSYPERRSDDFSPIKGPSGTSPIPAEANARAEMQLEPECSQRLQKGQWAQGGRREISVGYQEKMCFPWEGCNNGAQWECGTCLGRWILWSWVTWSSRGWKRGLQRSQLQSSLLASLFLQI